MNTLILSILGLCSGLMVSAGVFTVLFIVGLVPRFAGKTRTARCEILYEEFIIAGSVVGGILSVFPIDGSLGSWLSPLILIVLVIIIGAFAGIFVGCLSIALAEVLDGIPIFERRIGLKKGLSLIIVAVAMGKLAGSIVYFFFREVLIIQNRTVLYCTVRKNI